MDENILQELRNIGSQLNKLSSNLTSVKSTVGSIGFFSFLIIGLLALISNPQKSAHTSFSGDKSHVPAAMVDLATEYKSYYLWSVTRFRGKSETLTIGLFGNVFDKNFPDDFKEKISEIGK